MPAAVPLPDRGLAEGLRFGSGAEVVGDLGLAGRLVASQGEQVVGRVGEDLVGDVDLAANRVDAHQRRFELIGGRAVVEGALGWR